MENIELKDGYGRVQYGVTVNDNGVEIGLETPCGDHNTTAWAWLTFAEFDRIVAAVKRHRDRMTAVKHANLSGGA